MTNNKHSPSLIAILSATLLASSVQAMSLREDDDWSIRWDNTFKYQAVFRVEGPDREVYLADPDGNARAPFIGESTLSFDKGLVSNRIDWRTEFDVVWRDMAGFRISGAAWYDDVYHQSNDFPGEFKEPLQTWNGLTYGPGEFSDDTKRWSGGHGEILDAFAFWNWDVGDVFGNLRVGRHAIFYGESLLPIATAHSTAGAMTILDVAKGLASPGTEAKELFLPTNKLSTVIQLSEDWTLNAFYSLEWERSRSAWPGSYWAIGNGFTDDNEFAAIFPGRIVPTDPPIVVPRAGFVQRDANEPDDRGSNYGISLEYYSEALDLETSFHYVKTTKTNENNLVGRFDLFPPAPTALLPSTSGPAVRLGEYQWVFADDIDVFGLSFAKEIAGISMGMDITHLRDAALRGDLNAMFARPPTFDMDAVSPSNPMIPRGDVTSLVVNGVGLLNDNGFWEGGSFVYELTFTYLHGIDEFAQLGTRGDAHMRENGISTHGAFIFRPVWYQVFPSMDLTIPISIDYGLDGNSSLATGFNNQGAVGIGAQLNINNKWDVALRYTNRFGSIDNSLVGLIKDRDNIALTVKVTY